MGAQVISFALREPQQSTVADWTRDELAEFYRIEHALVQAGQTVDVDRGITDEGDPWFVFCRPDGEVLIHLTRYDGLYRLHSPALPAPLIGQSFAALTKSFSSQMPLNVMLRRDQAPRLFVHPAAMLAVLIGTIFAASNDLLIYAQHHDADKKHGDLADVTTAHALKALLQANFQTYIENFFSWLRDGPTFQQSTYIAMISTVAAFLVGADPATTVDRAHDGLLAAAGSLADGHARNAHDGASASAAPPSSAPDSTHRMADSKIVAAELPAQDAPNQNHDATGTVHTRNVEITNHATASAGANNGAPQGDPAVGSNATDATNASNLLLASANSDAPGQPITGTTNLTVTGPHPDLPLAQQSSAPQSSSSSTAFSTVAVNDLMTALSAAVQNNATGQSSQAGSSNLSLSSGNLDNLVSHAVDLTVTAGSQDLVSYFLTTTPTAPSEPAAAVSSGPSLFNSAAAATLVNFLEDNPTAEAVFNKTGVVIYDSLNDPTPASVEVWKFADGSTIAIVGHADHGFVA